jgi:hypothetical protein
MWARGRFLLVALLTVRAAGWVVPRDGPPPWGVLQGPDRGPSRRSDQKAAARPRPADRQLVTANGLLVAVVNDSGIVETISPAIDQSSPRMPRPFVRRLSLQGEERPLAVSYVHHTHIVRVKYRKLIVSYFAPFTTGERVFYAAIQGEALRVKSAQLEWEEGAEGLRTMEILFMRRHGEALKYLLFAFRDSPSGETGDLRPSRARLLTSRGSLLADEEKYLRLVIDHAVLPEGMSTDERAVAEQSITVLKMSQVSPYELEGHAQGGMVTSLLPGRANLAGAREASYAILALSRTGLFDEAREGLRFLLSAYPLDRLATEETDRKVGGAKIAFDDSGFFLTALCHYVHRSQDTLFLQEAYPRTARVADRLLALIAKNGLVQQGLHPSARPLARGEDASRSIAAWRGLESFAALSRESGHGDWVRYRRGAERLFGGITQHLCVGGKYLKGRAEASRWAEEGYGDGWTFEAFNFGLIKKPAIFSAHERVYREHLSAGGGFRMAGGADSSESIFLDLRVVSALSAFGGPARARRLLNRIVARCRLQNDLFCGLSIPGRVAPEGDIPLGSTAAYLLALGDLLGERSQLW